LSLNPKTKNKFWKWADAIILMRKHIKDYKPDVVIGIMLTCSMVSKIACTGFNIPTIMTEHHAFEFVKSEDYGIMRKRWFRYITDAFFPHVTVLTEADRQLIGNNLKNVMVMPNPLTFETVKEVPDKDKYLLAAGRVSDWHYKGFDILVEAWGKIAPKYSEWTLKIAGDGPKENFDFLKQKAAENGVLDKIEFLGYRTDILSLYKKAAIYVLSSRSEGLPMVLIEAMSQGCACVATDFKGRTKEIITNDDEGILCNPEDVDALAKGMEKLINDDEYRKKIQRDAIKRSEYYSLDNTMERWSKFLGDIVN
jgi:glycosyltransferase involved in cell wall biosynthesis